MTFQLPCAAVLGAALLASPAFSAEPETALALAGQPVLALAQHPDVSGGLRAFTGGHQRAAAERVRMPGPGLQVVEERFIYGWGCAPDGCAKDGLFLAYDVVRERTYLLLVEEGQVMVAVPPRRGIWPAALEAPLARFAPDISARLRFAPNGK